MKHTRNARTNITVLARVDQRTLASDFPRRGKKCLLTNPLPDLPKTTAKPKAHKKVQLERTGVLWAIDPDGGLQILNGQETEATAVDYYGLYWNPSTRRIGGGVHSLP